jgi:hypothetical protein
MALLIAETMTFFETRKILASAFLSLLALRLAIAAENPNPPIINSAPRSQTASVGDTITFSVLASGDPPLSYQWYFNGSPTSGSGETYTVSDVQQGDAGDYWVVVDNLGGSATSDRATLTVLAAPTIQVQPQSERVSVGRRVTFTVTATGPPPLTYQWLFNGVPIPGAIDASYTISGVQSSNDGRYEVRVSSGAGSVTSAPAILSVIGSVGAPNIVAEPLTQAVVSGTNVTFTVIATGDEPLIYQWQLNGVDIPGATGASLTITNVQTANLGAYTVSVGNQFGVVFSQSAALSLQSLGLRLSVPQIINNAVQLSALLESGPSYRLLTSTNLLAWIDATNAISGTTNFVFSEAFSTNVPMKFYRIAAP